MGSRGEVPAVRPARPDERVKARHARYRIGLRPLEARMAEPDRSVGNGRRPGRVTATTAPAASRSVPLPWPSLRAGPAKLAASQRRRPASAGMFAGVERADAGLPVDAAPDGRDRRAVRRGVRSSASLRCRDGSGHARRRQSGADPARQARRQARASGATGGGLARAARTSAIMARPVRPTTVTTVMPCRDGGWGTRAVACEHPGRQGSARRRKARAAQPRDPACRIQRPLSQPASARRAADAGRSRTCRTPARGRRTHPDVPGTGTAGTLESSIRSTPCAAPSPGNPV